MKPQQTLKKILTILQKKYHHIPMALTHDNPEQLIFAVILSAQCTDKRVNLVTPNLFKKYPTLESLADCKLGELEKIIHSTGFYKNKAKNIKACAQMLVKKHHSKVPNSMEQLVELPGVGRKTANVILAECFDKNEGVCVDTHVGRMAQRLGFSKGKNAIQIEKDLMKISDSKDWKLITHSFINHGRFVCNSRKPKCADCEIRSFCKYGTTVSAITK